MKHLVNSAHGVYAWQVLVDNYYTYDENGKRVSPDFDPDKEGWCELIEEWEGRLTVEAVQGEFLPVQQIEGDIWAIEPTDVWCEEEQRYTESLT